MTEIITEAGGGIQRVQIYRPDKKNALTAAMYQGLADALAMAEANAAVRVILLHGTDTVFTAGNDLHDFLHQHSTLEGGPLSRFIQAVSHATKPIVAAVAGPAIGIGTTMLLHCDLVYAADNARFHMPFVDLGLVPELASSLLLAALAGQRRAAEWLLLGRPFDPAQAVAAGLVNAVVPPSKVLEVAMAAAQALAAKPAASLRLTKALMKRPVLPAIESAMREETARFVAQLASPEAKEAFTAFLERRKPDFSKFQ
jgi:enoyl-CoA hydratase/carnithine racemase